MNHGHLLLLASAATLAFACSGTKGPRKAPPPITITPGVTNGREVPLPTLTPIAASTLKTGRLNGGVYAIEMPDSWNGRLVLYIHGGQEGFGREVTASLESPPLRRYLLDHGYAWAESSLDRPEILTGAAADQTAAVWDLFVQQFRVPDRSYAFGVSMGGAGAIISAERYADRYDGALAVCGIAGAIPLYEVEAEYDLAAAYVENIGQAEFDRTAISSLVFGKIVPALADDFTNSRLTGIWTQLTGGRRPYAEEGLSLEAKALQDLGRIQVQAGLVDNTSTTYVLPQAVAETNADFNRKVIRVAGAHRAELPASEEITGDLKIPLLTLHTTGDGLVPISHEQFVRRKVEAARKSSYLVQQTIQAPEHCGFTGAEYETAFESLVAWVERGRKPHGDDVLADDLTHLGEEFTVTPRLGSKAADLVPGAGERVTVHGTLTFNGKSLASDAKPGDRTYHYLVSAIVLRDGLITPCEINQQDPALDGTYRRVIASESELHGCGTDGAHVALGLYTTDGVSLSLDPPEWTALKNSTALDADLTTRGTTRFTGLAGRSTTRMVNERRWAARLTPTSVRRSAVARRSLTRVRAVISS
jgi:pimeloyl-ACP methyl ester carboxylesterase